MLTLRFRFFISSRFRGYQNIFSNDSDTNRKFFAFIYVSSSSGFCLLAFAVAVAKARNCKSLDFQSVYFVPIQRAFNVGIAFSYQQTQASSSSM